MRYALLICIDESTGLGPQERQDREDAFTAYAERLRQRGVDRGAERLRPTATATTVRVRDGEVVIADGPFAETKEQMGGFFLVECRDLDEALELAADNPGALYGTVEVRPLWER
jgi:hypothetical protein